MRKNRSRKSRSGATWVTVSVEHSIHGKVRALAVLQHKDWATVLSEAMRLWVAAQAHRAA